MSTSSSWVQMKTNRTKLGWNQAELDLDSIESIGLNIHVTSGAGIPVDPPSTANARLPFKDSKLVGSKNFLQTTAHCHAGFPSPDNEHRVVGKGVSAIGMAFVNTCDRRHFESQVARNSRSNRSGTSGDYRMVRYQNSDSRMIFGNNTPSEVRCRAACERRETPTTAREINA